ncbi:hypothetical protein AN958_06829 [Leucoagaricus sp. SymC.cos]|nr:hypothetical protein AN958_06829 [Leucoagaricus sp. SymC.cos]
MIQGEEQYEVEGIVNHRYCKEGLQYLVKWKGYGHQENKWIHEDKLTRFADELIQKYLKSHKMPPKTHLTPKRPI